MSFLGYEGNANIASEVEGRGGATTLGSSITFNPYAELLGEIDTTKIPDARSAISYTNYDFLDAYIGKNQHLSHTVKGLLLTDDEWPLFLIPMMETNNVHFVWTVWKPDRVLAQVVPSEGVSRLLTSRREVTAASSVRRGVSFQMEGDYLKTPEGRTAFMLNIVNVVKTFTETMKEDTIFRLVTCNESRAKWHRQSGLMHAPLHKIIEFEVKRFASVNASPGSLLNEVDTYHRMLSNAGARPDSLIVPPECSAFLAGSNTDTGPTPYIMVGLNGQVLKRDGPPAMALLRQGVRVFEMRDVLYDDNAPRLQPLCTLEVVAEHYTALFKDLALDHTDRKSVV